MKLNRILCPIDFSEYSQSANFFASTFAQSSDAQIIYLHVLEHLSKSDDAPAEIDSALLKFSNQIRPFAHEVRRCYEVRAGNPAQMILDVADENNVDLIVMGTHGRTGSKRLLHGSVCAKVLRKANCGVMAVKSAINLKWLLPATSDEAAT